MQRATGGTRKKGKVTGRRMSPTYARKGMIQLRLVCKLFAAKIIHCDGAVEGTGGHVISGIVNVNVRDVMIVDSGESNGF